MADSFDPDKALGRARHALRWLDEFDKHCEEQEHTDTGEFWEIAEKIQQNVTPLIDWLDEGGRLPADWNPERPS